MSLHRCRIYVHSLQQRIQRNITNILIVIQQKSTENIHSQNLTKYVTISNDLNNERGEGGGGIKR